MNKIIRLFGLFFLIAKLGFTQTYVAFPDSNTVWSVDTTKYFVHGDSVYNSLTYKKYYLSSDSNLAPSSWRLAGLVRQDTAHKRIYGIKLTTSVERLLYDFSLNPSDTVGVYPMDFSFSPPAPFILKILAKDSVLINGRYRTRLKAKGFYTSSGWTEYWIEGIGSVYGPLNPGLVAWNVADYCVPTLLCQKVNGALLYMNSQYNTCYFNTCLTGIYEYSKSNLVTLFPNPNSGSFSVQVQNSTGNSIEIYNMLGERIRVESLRNLSTIMDLTTQPKGMYFYRVISENKFIGSGKLVIE
jgi:hypothetical protein